METGNRRFRLRRLELEMTQEDLAKQVDGIYTPDISRIEAGGWIPPAEVQERLARALQTTPALLFGPWAVSPKDVSSVPSPAS